MKSMIEKLRNINWLAVLVTVIIVTSVISIVFISYNRYERNKADRQRAIAVQQAKKDEIIAVQKAVHQASISRLVSICMTVQEQFDRSTAKEKVGKVRPDCTVVE